jgi:hypothetical protein
MKKSGKYQSSQAGLMAAIDDMHLDIKNLEAQTQANQGIYDDMVQEIKAKLEQRIKEVKEGAKILGFVDLEAANLATDLKVKALEEKLVIFEKKERRCKSCQRAAKPKGRDS